MNLLNLQVNSLFTSILLISAAYQALKL